MQKTISVILPVHNGEKYIADSIKSILSQDYPFFELLILNDGSTDTTESIVSTFMKDKRVKLYTFDKLGLISVLNAGLSLAKGDYIARMDADDISLPNRFSTQIGYFERDINLGVLGTGTYICDDALTFTHYGVYPSKHSGINKLMHEGNYICHPSVMFKRNLVDKYGGYSQFFLHAEDYELWLRFSQHTVINNTSERLLIYRQHDTNVSFVKFPHQAMTAEVISKYYGVNQPELCEISDVVDFAFLREICDDEEFEAILVRWRSAVNGMIASGRLSLDQVENNLISFLHDS